MIDLVVGINWVYINNTIECNNRVMVLFVWLILDSSNDLLIGLVINLINIGIFVIVVLYCWIIFIEERFIILLYL